MHQNSKIIRSRKSIFPRQFNGLEITEEVIHEILENANYAPSHRMTQPWFFKVFSGKSKQILVNEILNNNDINFNELAKEKLIINFKKTSHVICICMKRNKIVPEWEEIAATSMSVQNIWLSCVNRNIGGYWSTPPYMKYLKGFLNLNEDDRLLGFFYLGCYDIINERNISRRNYKEKFEIFN
tara:strand:+ start:922 stop:1470 length:549 start_codon:yes stop_codon:yes gene_type:complete